MSVSDDEHGKQDVAADEELCRRIPVSQNWYDKTHNDVSPQAFRPLEDDTTGLSLYRRRLISPAELAQQGRSQHGYYVAILAVADLLDAGIEVRQDDPSEPSHVVLPGLRYDNRKSDDGVELMEKLAPLVTSVDGPFSSAQSE